MSSKITEWISSLFSSSGIVVETELVEETFEHTFEYKVDRNFILVHFSNDSPMAIEYDYEKSQRSSDKTKYYAERRIVRDRLNSSLKAHLFETERDQLTKVNEMATTHTESLGSATVTLSRTAKITHEYERVSNIDELPTRGDGCPERGNTYVRQNGSEIGTSYGRTFSEVDNEWVAEPSYSFEEWVGPTEVDAEMNLAEAIQSAVSGVRTDAIQAVTASGSIALPETTASQNDDIISVEALPDE